MQQDMLCSDSHSNMYTQFNNEYGHISVQLAHNVLPYNLELELEEYRIFAITQLQSKLVNALQFITLLALMPTSRLQTFHKPGVFQQVYICGYHTVLMAVLFSVYYTLSQRTVVRNNLSYEPLVISSHSLVEVGHQGQEDMVHRVQVPPDHLCPLCLLSVLSFQQDPIQTHVQEITLPCLPSEHRRELC